MGPICNLQRKLSILKTTYETLLCNLQKYSVKFSRLNANNSVNYGKNVLWDLDQGPEFVPDKPFQPSLNYDRNNYDCKTLIVKANCKCECAHPCYAITLTTKTTYLKVENQAQTTFRFSPVRFCATKNTSYIAFPSSRVLA